VVVVFGDAALRLENRSHCSRSPEEHQAEAVLRTLEVFHVNRRGHSGVQSHHLRCATEGVRVRAVVVDQLRIRDLRASRARSSDRDDRSVVGQNSELNGLATLAGWNLKVAVDMQGKELIQHIAAGVFDL
jgi:hypothetical protein